MLGSYNNSFKLGWGLKYEVLKSITGNPGGQIDIDIRLSSSFIGHFS